MSGKSQLVTWAEAAPAPAPLDCSCNTSIVQCVWAGRYVYAQDALSIRNVGRRKGEPVNYHLRQVPQVNIQIGSSRAIAIYNQRKQKPCRGTLCILHKLFTGEFPKQAKMFIIGDCLASLNYGDQLRKYFFLLWFFMGQRWSRVNGNDSHATRSSDRKTKRHTGSTIRGTFRALRKLFKLWIRQVNTMLLEVLQKCCSKCSSNGWE